MATFTTLEASVFAVLRDSEKAFVTSAEVKEWLNEGYLDLVARTGILKKSTSSTTSSTGTVALPADFVRVASKDGFYVATGTSTVESPLFTRSDIYLGWKNSTSTPHRTLYRIFGANIETYPIVASKAYTLEYVYKPTALSAGGDIPAIPEELHVKLVHYARAHAKYKEGELQEGDRYFGMYEMGLPPTIPDTERDFPGPIDFVPVPSYWDDRA